MCAEFEIHIETYVKEVISQLVFEYRLTFLITDFPVQINLANWFLWLGLSTLIFPRKILQSEFG